VNGNPVTLEVTHIILQNSVCFLFALWYLAFRDECALGMATL